MNEMGVTVVDKGQMVLQIPAKLLAEVLDLSGPQHEVIDALTWEWVVIAREAEVLGGRSVAWGFGDREALAAWLEQHYRAKEIVAVLHNGRPVKFNMRVRARIG